MKKRIRRGLKEGDPGFLGQASETDSALEDSSSGSDDGSDSDSESSDRSGSDDDADDEIQNGDEIPVAKHLRELFSNDGEVTMLIYTR